MHRALLILAMLTLWPVPAALGQEATPAQVHVILFVPSDVQPAPEACRRRIDEIVTYAEHFFRDGLRRWGHEDVVMPFRRGEDEKLEVMTLRGKHPTASYRPVPLRAEVMDALRAQGRIGRQRQVWWIFVYPGEPPARFDGYLGGYGEEIGGWAISNLDTTPGRIDPRAPLGSDFLVKLMLKGTLHELGHGLGLPHVGPMDADDAGNTLMGPTHRNWRRVRGDRDKRVYLSEAEAAMLSLRPVFRGAPDPRGALPKAALGDVSLRAGEGGEGFVVRGRLESPSRAVYALVADESDDRPGGYWSKTYVGRVEQGGTFTVRITEPAPADGTLRIWFVFENGDQTGDGRRRGYDGAVARRYVYEQERWRLE